MGSGKSKRDECKLEWVDTCQNGLRQVGTDWSKSKRFGTSRNGFGTVGTGWTKTEQIRASRNGMRQVNRGWGKTERDVASWTRLGQVGLFYASRNGLQNGSGQRNVLNSIQSDFKQPVNAGYVC